MKWFTQWSLITYVPGNQLVRVQIGIIFLRVNDIPSWELTYPIKKLHFEDDFPKIPWWG